MTRFVLTIFGFACIGLWPAVYTPAGENHALLVGVADYDEKELRPLKFTRADVIDFHAALLESGFKAGNAILLHDDFEKLVAHYRKLGADYKPKDYIPTGANIRREAALLLGRLRADDSVIVAFAGHGVQFKAEKKSYFCPADAGLDRKDSLIGFDEMFTALKDCAAGRKLFLVDACQNDPQSEISRSRATVDLDSVTRPQSEPVPEGIIALFSCKAGQRAFEHPPLGHGVFFHHLLDGWSGKADANDDGRLSYQELAAYTERKTSEYAALKLKVLQTPVLRNEFSGGEWVLREIPRATLPPPLFDAKNGKTAAEAKASQEAWAKHLKTSVEVENSVGMKLRLIPPGEYRRGSTAEELDAVTKLDPMFRKEFGDDEQPQHTVRITKPFRISVTEVTRGQFRRFVSATGYVTEAEKDDGGWGWNEKEKKFEGRRTEYNWRNTGVPQTDDHPVSNVTWNDAQAFVRWLGREDRSEYRLPTEAEWEYACRAGTTSPWHSGAAIAGLEEVANVADATAGEKWTDHSALGILAAPDGYPFAAPVGKFRANGFGLADMHGNVWEWCADWYDAKEHAKHAGRTVEDPRGPSSGSYRVCRGSSWRHAPMSARSAERRRLVSGNRDDHLGIRVLAVLPVR